MFKKLFSKPSPNVDGLYAAIVAASRRPLFYETHGVPDTVDGRFDMIILHLFLVFERLSDRDTKQALVDVFFADMDRSLREMGVGDLSVGKKVRKMAEACFGRLNAYEKAVTQEDAESAVTDVLARNVFADGGQEHAASLARWVLAARGQMKVLSAEQLENQPWP